MTNRASAFLPARVFFGFVAGFFATLIFHQLMLAVLWGIGIAASAPFPMRPTQPFGVPAVISLAFWGGIWGIIFALIERTFARLGGYWVAAIVFGAIFPTLVAFLLVFPLKGLPMGGGWHFSMLLTGLLVNGAWGLGTAIFFRAFLAWSRVSEGPFGVRGRV
jgi:hypothetical protein